MGTFMGHFLPGIFFIIMAVWWTFAALNRHYRILQRKSSQRYQTSAAFLCSACNGRQLPIESCLKILFVCLGITGELITGMEHGSFKFIGNAQHATMYALFGFSGVIDLLIYMGVRFPKNIEYCWGIVAFISEALLFEFHLHLHKPVAVAMHKLLFYTVWATVIALVVEMKWPHNVLGTLTRAYFVLLQGTWFVQIGADLYLPSNSSSTSVDATTAHTGGGHPMEAHHRAVEMAAIKFSWHMFGVFGFMMLVAAVVNACHRPHLGTDVETHSSNVSDPLLMDPLEDN